MGFWINIGAAQRSARAKGAKPAHVPHWVVSIIVGILLALLMAAGLLMLFWASSR
jgi:hypothetical protein